jgi:hypothetical protein
MTHCISILLKARNERNETKEKKRNETTQNEKKKSRAKKRNEPKKFEKRNEKKTGFEK